jgi:hypothetical protein
VQDTSVGEEAGVPNAIVLVAPAIGVLLVLHENVPMVVDALSIAGFVAAAPY